MNDASVFFFLILHWDKKSNPPPHCFTILLAFVPKAPNLYIALWHPIKIGPRLGMGLGKALWNIYILDFDCVVLGWVLCNLSGLWTVLLAWKI